MRDFPAGLLATESHFGGFLPDSYLIGVAAASSPISKTFCPQKNPLAFANGLFFLELVPEMGLEPTHLTAYAPQTYVSTIPPPGLMIVSGEPGNTEDLNWWTQ